MPSRSQFMFQFQSGALAIVYCFSSPPLPILQPLICCPSRQGGSGKFLSKVTWRKDQPQRENSDSDTDQSENSAKDAG